MARRLLISKEEERNFYGGIMACFSKGVRELVHLFVDLWWFWVGMALVFVIIGGVTYVFATFYLEMK